jgi:hypothetical protein
MDAVCFIADNDETAENSPENMEPLISVQLVAHIFLRSAAEVAEDVIRVRNNLCPKRRKRKR